MKILVSEKLSTNGMSLLKESFEVDERLGLTYNELLENISAYDALVVRSATKVDAQLINSGINLKVIGRAGTGVDNIDVDAASKKGIIVVNTPDSNNIATAELTIAMMLSLARNIPKAYTVLKEGKWMRSVFSGVEICNKYCVVIGLGRIGSIVASRLKAFGMNVFAYDPYVTDERFEKLGVKKLDTIEEVMRIADFITIHLPKTEETKDIIGREQLNLAKPNLRLVNCARGGLVNEDALYDFLKDKRIAGAAIDVYEKEPKEGQGGADFKHKFLELDNVVLTPHLGASTAEAQENVGIAIAEQVIAALKGNIVNAVNLPGLQMDNMAALSPYLELARIIGKLYYQIEKQPAEKVEITYSGEIAGKETKLITLSYLSGLLETITEDRVNFVNVEAMIREYGIEVTVSTRSEVEYYTNLVTVKVTNKDKALTFAGTVFGKKELRIVNFVGYEVDFVPTSFMLAVQNIDKPGVIGRIGTIMGKAGINIATMRVSRNRKENKAVMIINIDSWVNEETLRELESIDGILKVKLLKM